MEETVELMKPKFKPLTIPKPTSYLPKVIEPRSIKHEEKHILEEQVQKRQELSPQQFFDQQQVQREVTGYKDFQQISSVQHQVSEVNKIVMKVDQTFKEKEDEDIQVMWEISELENQLEYIQKNTEECAQQKAASLALLEHLKEKFVEVEQQISRLETNLDFIEEINRTNQSYCEQGNVIINALDEDYHLVTNKIGQNEKRMERLIEMMRECNIFEDGEELKADEYKTEIAKMISENNDLNREIQEILPLIWIEIEILEMNIEDFYSYKLECYTSLEKYDQLKEEVSCLVQTYHASASQPKEKYLLIYEQAQMILEDCNNRKQTAYAALTDLNKAMANGEQAEAELREYIRLLDEEKFKANRILMEQEDNRSKIYNMENEIRALDADSDRMEAEIQLRNEKNEREHNETIRVLNLIKFFTSAETEANSWVVELKRAKEDFEETLESQLFEEIQMIKSEIQQQKEYTEDLGKQAEKLKMEEMEVSERHIMGQEECRSLKYEIIMRKEIIEMENADKESHEFRQFLEDLKFKRLTCDVMREIGKLEEEIRKVTISISEKTQYNNQLRSQIEIVQKQKKEENMKRQQKFEEAMRRMQEQYDREEKEYIELAEIKEQLKKGNFPSELKAKRKAADKADANTTIPPVSTPFPGLVEMESTGIEGEEAFEKGEKPTEKEKQSTRMITRSIKSPSSAPAVTSPPVVSVGRRANTRSNERGNAAIPPKQTKPKTSKTPPPSIPPPTPAPTSVSPPRPAMRVSSILNPHKPVAPPPPITSSQPPGIRARKFSGRIPLIPRKDEDASQVSMEDLFNHDI